MQTQTNPHKATVKIIFLTLFLDLVGFSIIFPLFPALMDYYYALDPTNPFLQVIISSMDTIMSWTGAPATVSPIVLFGGILGALYSVLQFLFAPFWGSLSDHIGRKSVLLITVAGIAVSYIGWFFAGSFTLLVLARFLGGLMSGNLSTATAVIGDITTPATRSRGMAVVGIAFGTGFVLGPALGGIASLVRLDLMWPALTAYGLNPFSAPALLALIFSLVNLLVIAFKFKETLPAEKRTADKKLSLRNPFSLFKPLSDPQINRINFTNFIFLIAFAGMEFTLTFLAAERLNYTPLQNGYMFIYLGVLIALVQGGYVRRKANQVGEKKLALLGMLILMPGYALAGFAHTNLMLYVSLTFFAIGSSLIMPCLAALCSLFASEKIQGKALGTFRSMGALSRVIGPLIASVLYWRLGATTTYLIVGSLLILPIFFLSRIPQPTQS